MVPTGPQRDAKPSETDSQGNYEAALPSSQEHTWRIPLWFYSGANSWELGIWLPHILRLWRRPTWVWSLLMGQCEQSRAGLRRAIGMKESGTSLTIIKVWLLGAHPCRNGNAIKLCNGCSACRHTEFPDRLTIQGWPWAKAMLWQLRYECIQYIDNDIELQGPRTSYQAPTAVVKDGGYQRPEWLGRSFQSCPDKQA